jgi:hypothetical protein
MTVVRQWFQFSLRDLAIATVWVALLCGIGVFVREKHARPNLQAATPTVVWHR